MRCAEIHPNLAAFVLDGLEPEEAAEIRRHLASCPRCQDEVRELRKVNRALEAAPPPADPPSYLKEGILSRVRAERLSVSDKEEPQGSSFEDRTGSSWASCERSPRWRPSSWYQPPARPPGSKGTGE